MLLDTKALGFTLPPGVALVLWLIVIVSVTQPSFSITSSVALYHNVFARANIVNKGDCVPCFNPNL